MRWDNLRLDEPLDTGGGEDLFTASRRDRAVPLIERGAVTRTFDTPSFRGMTFYEVQAKSVVNRVPEASRMPFRWTINPYRGCQHSCVYCFARNSHTYLDLDAGADFNTRVVVKVNAPELVRKKMASPSWAGEHIAMGTNVDCYQRAEGRYQLMPGIIGALSGRRQPVLHPDQGHADPQGHRAAGGGGRSHRGGTERLSRLCRQRSLAVNRAGYARARAAARGVRDAERARAALRRAHGPGGAVPLRLPRPSSTRRSGRSPRPAPGTSCPSCCTCARAPGSGSSAGCGLSIPGWSRRTWTCTAAAPTPPRPTRTGSPARSASSRRNTASAAPGPASVTAACARDPPPPAVPPRPRHPAAMSQPSGSQCVRIPGVSRGARTAAKLARAARAAHLALSNAMKPGG